MSIPIPWLIMALILVLGAVEFYVLHEAAAGEPWATRLVDTIFGK